MTEDEARAWLVSYVSRETLDRLDRYASALIKWQGAINLVAPATIETLWARHMVDSAQIFPLCKVQAGKWLDIGSGAGFPGMVCAIIAQEKAPDLSFHFIESDLRKGAFLREIARDTGADAHVMTRRVEDTPPQGAQVISARALADLSRLFEMSCRHLATGGQCLFLKGQNAAAEVDAARESWQWTQRIHSSVTSDQGQILEIEELSHV